MSSVPAAQRVDSALAAVDQAVTAGKLTDSARRHLRTWLVEERYAEYREQVVAHVERGEWKTLDDVFWTIIPFGTGGRRGRMYPIGCNAINDRTIGESAQGLADYLNDRPAGSRRCAIAYDTRHNSRHFAELCAGIMVANGFTIEFLDDYRSTPELSFLVRRRNCDAGIMVTASHNPPSDNAVKVYGATGGQLIPPDDTGVIDRVMAVDRIRSVPFAQALADGKVTIRTAETDVELLEVHATQSLTEARDVRIVYSPLHGVGEKNVCDLLTRVGFRSVEVFGPHRQPDGDFPNVPQHVSNPENPKVFDAIIARAKEIGASLALATDPDCDRMGAAAPITADVSGPWGTFTGNQLGALLTDYVLRRRAALGTLSPEHYVVKTLVTGDLIARIAESHGIGVRGNLHVGFKWIGREIDRSGPETFVLGTEESHGYLVGSYARDKDGAVACLLMAEAAADAKARGVSLHQQLDSLFVRHGYHGERLINITMTGSDGMARMERLMARLRQSPPTEVGGVKVERLRDYGALIARLADGSTEPIDADPANMVMLDLADAGNRIAVRPSGTEPKVKLYMFTRLDVPSAAELERVRAAGEARLDAFAKDLQALAASVE
ncbi:MAG TPA: phospho-sugar mutase [Planctomycetaceae bacterium]|nr:phospho-sugar mutase [Planctomycetaceae bacterium]HRE99727.1 phospho-sugar mutase [Pirellulaceae bacterium]